MKRKLTALLLAAALLLSLAACGQENTLTRYQASFLDLFDTVTVITGYAESKQAFTDTVQQLYDALKEYHELYDIYHAYSGINNICTINQAGGAAVAVDQRIIALLQFARQMYDRTGGMVNVAMGSVLALWHDAREAGINDPENAALPSDEALQQAAQHMDIADLVIDEAAGTVQLLDPELRLDVGAVAKGYATEQVAQAFAAAGLSGYVLSVGGNVRAIGSNLDGSAWTVGLEQPDGSDGYLCRVGIRDQAVVTSGSYQRYYTVDGQRYHHIIHPETLYPSNRYLSVSVLCSDSGVADAYSTALFNLSYEEGLALVEETADLEAFWVLPDGTQLCSSGFDAYRITD